MSHKLCLGRVCKCDAETSKSRGLIVFLSTRSSLTPPDIHGEGFRTHGLQALLAQALQTGVSDLTWKQSPLTPQRLLKESVGSQDNMLSKQCKRVHTDSVRWLTAGFDTFTSRRGSLCQLAECSCWCLWRKSSVKSCLECICP